MFAFITYELKVAAVLAAFYLCFKCFLSQEKLHRFNRAVLIATAVLSFVLPLCVITVHKTVAVPGLVGTGPVGSIENQSVVPMLPQSARHFSWMAVVTVAYMTGVLCVLISVFAAIVRVKKLINNSEEKQLYGCKVMVCDQSVPPFSWMSWIVMCREDFESGNKHILEHEKAHISLGHSKDVLLVDILSAFQWFNPAMWLLKRDLRAIHEYEADDAVLRGGANIREYQYSLIRKAVSASGYSITNSFNHSILKNRITMMSKPNASRKRWLRALYILPLVCGALALNARTVTDYKVSEKDSVNQGSVIRVEIKMENGRPAFYVEGKKTTLGEISGRVGALMADNEFATVQLSGEMELDSETINEVMEELRKAETLSANCSEAAPATENAKPEVFLDIRDIGNGDCACFINGSQIAIDDVVGKVSQAKADNNEVVVGIRAGAGIRYGIISDLQVELRPLSGVKVVYLCDNSSSEVSSPTAAKVRISSTGVPEYDFEGVRRNDIHCVRINSVDNVLFDTTIIGINDIYGMMVETIGSNHNSNFLLQLDRGSSFGAFFSAQKQMKEAVDFVRNEFSMERFGKPLDKLSDKERNIIMDELPLRISELEAKNLKNSR